MLKAQLPTRLPERSNQIVLWLIVLTVIVGTVLIMIAAQRNLDRQKQAKQPSKTVLTPVPSYSPEPDQTADTGQTDGQTDQQAPKKDLVASQADTTDSRPITTLIQAQPAGGNSLTQTSPDHHQDNPGLSQQNQSLSSSREKMNQEQTLAGMEQSQSIQF